MAVVAGTINWLPAQLIPKVRKRRLSQDELGAWRALVRAYSAVTRALDREAEATGGLPLSSYWVLLVLAESPARGIRLCTLADEAFLSRSGLTRALDRLEEQGLVERRASENDRRGQYATLTPRGRRALVRSTPAHLRGLATHFADELTDREAAVIRTALDRIGDKAQRPGESAPV